jgi:hypothetical protein
MSRGFCIFVDALLEGPVPLVRDEHGRPVIFATEMEAQREIADNQLTRLQQFIDGQREFEDAMAVEEYVLPVEVLSNGTLKFPGSDPC